MPSKLVTAFVRACVEPDKSSWVAFRDIHEFQKEFAEAHDELSIESKPKLGQYFSQAMEEEFEGPYRQSHKRVEGKDHAISGYRGIKLTYWDDRDEEPLETNGAESGVEAN